MSENEPWVFLRRREPFDGVPDNKAPETAWDVIRLWEVRRIRYNLIIGTLFAVVWLLATILFMIFLGGGDFLSDLQVGLYIGLGCPILLAIMNLCFTIGWASELLIRAVARHRVDNYGPAAYTVLTALSIVAVPVLVIWHLLMMVSAMCN